MFGFVNTKVKQKFSDNNNILIDLKKRERRFKFIFSLLAFAILNIVLYLLTRSY